MRHDPFDEIRRLQREMDRILGDMWSGGEERFLSLPAPTKRGDYLPDVFREPVSDLKETDKQVIASIEMPGVSKKDIQLNVTEDGLEVKVEQKHEMKEEKKGYVRMESGYRSYYRRLPFPTKVIADKAEAKYENGVLEVTVPKLQIDTKKKKMIEVK